MPNKALVIQSHIAQLAERVNTTFLSTEEERVKLNDWEWLDYQMRPRYLLILL